MTGRQDRSWFTRFPYVGKGQFGSILLGGEPDCWQGARLPVTLKTVPCRIGTTGEMRLRPGVGDPWSQSLDCILCAGL